MIIDVHGHWGPWFFSMDVGSLSTHLEILDRYDIAIQMVSSVEGIAYEASRGNHGLAEVLRDTSRLRGMLVIDPRNLASAERDVTDLVPSGLFVGAKIHPQYTGVGIDSPLMRDALQLCAENGLVTMVHTGSAADLMNSAAVVNSIPSLRMIAAHMGLGGWQAVGDCARMCSRIWFEPASSIAYSRRIRTIVDDVGSGRIVFGTDAPLLDPGLSVGAIQAAHLSQAELQAVMGGNAAKLFAL